MILIVEGPIDVATVLASVQTERAGGVVHFIGTVRQDGDITGLHYECYPEMAQQRMADLAEAATRRLGLEKVSAVHRVGWVPLGEVAVVIAVSSAHRAEAFEGCRWMIDQIKQEAPIWKKDGTGCCACS